MVSDAAHQESLKSWDERAVAWGRRSAHVSEVSRPVTDWLIERLDPQAGQIILELACGAGDVGREVAKRLLSDGQVLSTDFSPAMVGVAQARSKEAGATNITHRIMDAQNSDLDDESIDGIICRYGFMLMMDPAAALKHGHRVLRSGGRVSLAVWGDPVRNPWIVGPGMAGVALGIMEMKDPLEPGSAFSMSEPQVVTTLLEGAGFADIETEEIDVVHTFAGMDERMEHLADSGGPLAAGLAQASQDQLGSFRAMLEDTYSPYKNGDAYELPGVALVAAASKP